MPYTTVLAVVADNAMQMLATEIANPALLGARMPESSGSGQ